MSNEIPLTIVGNITKDPELRYRPGGGEAVLRFTVASTPHYYSKAERDYVDGETTFMPCWVNSRGGEPANAYPERLSQTFRRGDHVIVVGDLVTQAKDRDGETRRWNELRVRDVGASPRFADVTIDRDSDVQE
ncbi:MAG: single-stranded DNA-binding protein [Kocuria sp.]|uniref:single-stranded DNA-binding protein n=1 Tax=uncultured Corynebacterium sp. TaxID=159447 RepID=UPI0015B869A8|nr:single-stranded DNA-binding protein [uncultured Corynebacterium sp.]MDN5605587.1 single-stranded DNA-binding protein [Kocuria sp.]